MPDNVIRLRGNTPVSHPGNPSVDVIEELERLLEMARAGELTGIAYATEYFDNATGGKMVGAVSRSLSGMLFSLQIQISKQLDDL